MAHFCRDLDVTSDLRTLGNQMPIEVLAWDSADGRDKEGIERSAQLRIPFPWLHG
jgi:hypothetical protein